MKPILLGPLADSQAALSLYSFLIPAGFPSPAQDHVEGPLSLDEALGIRAPHMYLARASGNSMLGVGIYDRDLLIIDRSRLPESGQIVIAALNGEPLVKIYCVENGQVILRSANDAYAPRYLLEGDELGVWGVVTYSVRQHGYY